MLENVSEYDILHALHIMKQKSLKYAIKFFFYLIIENWIMYKININIIEIEHTYDE